MRIIFNSVVYFGLFLFSFLVLLVLSVLLYPRAANISQLSPLLIITGLSFLSAGIIFHFIKNSKGLRIVGVALGTLSSLLLIHLIGISGIVNPLWGSIDCGGIDPGFNIGCSRELYGKKKKLFLIYVQNRRF